MPDDYAAPDYRPCSGVDNHIFFHKGFVSNCYGGDARGFRFWAENKTKKVQIGGELKFDKYTHIHVNLPQSAVVHLVKDGQKFAVQKGESLVFDINEPGCYRVEAYYFERPWIFSNHIRIL